MTRNRDSGFGLLELVIAMALFSVVALMGAQVLRMSVRFQETLAQQSDAADELSRGLALLRSDLSNAVLLAVDIAPDTTVLRRIDTLDPDQPGTLSISTVTWRLDRAQSALTRHQGEADDTAQPMFGEVTDFELRLLGADGKWTPAPSLKNAQVIDGKDTPAPRSIEALLDTARGPLRVLVTP